MQTEGGQRGKGRLALGGILGLLLLGAAVAQTMAPWPYEGGWSKAAADGGEGGSTLPAPPGRPTPRPGNQPSPPATPEAGGAAGLDLSTLELSLSTRAQSPEGRFIPAGGALRIEAGPTGDQQVILPLALAPGQNVAGFRDPESGISWLPASSGAGGGVLAIPLRGGQSPGTLSIRLGPLQGNGRQAQAAILGAELAAGPVEIGGSGALGGAVRLSAALRRLPPDILVDVQGIAVDDGTASAIGEAARQLQTRTAAIAYAVKVKANLETPIDSAAIEMGVERAWTDAQPGGAVRIARVDDQGRAAILATASAGEDSRGRVWFQAAPEGFSTFALVALADLPSVEPMPGARWPLWLGVGLGAAALAGAFLARASHRRGPTT